MKKVIGWLIESNIFIGLCAVALALQVFIPGVGSYIKNSPQLPVLFIPFLFFSTISVYLINRHGKIWKNKGYPTFFNLLFIISIAFTAYFFYQLNFNSVTSLNYKIWFVPVILTLLYSLHIFFGRNNRLNIRSVGILKLFLIAAVWTWMTNYIPQILYHSKMNWLMVANQFIFILAITIPFDIRDSVQETALGFKTIPALIGKDAAVKVSKALVIIYWILGGFLGASYLVACSVCAVLLVYWLNRLDRLKDWKDWVVRFDGIMIIQAALVIGTTYLISGS